MKFSNYLIFGFVIAVMIGCNNEKKNEDNKAIIGIWQNTTNPDASIEFTKDGEYFIRFNGERILNNDSVAEKYSYNSISNGNNLIIYGNPRADNTQGRLVVIAPGRIKISLVHQGTIVSEAEFTKVKEE